MFSSCSHGGRGRLERKKEKELIREREKNTDSEIGTFQRQRQAVKKETIRGGGRDRPPQVMKEKDSELVVVRDGTLPKGAFS